MQNNFCYFQIIYSFLFWFFFSISYFPWLYVPVSFIVLKTNLSFVSLAKTDFETEVPYLFAYKPRP